MQLTANKTRLEFTVIGETVNVASKFEKYNKKVNTKCLISEQAYKTGLKQGFESKLEWKLFENQNVAGTDYKICLMGISK